MGATVSSRGGSVQLAGHGVLTNDPQVFIITEEAMKKLKHSSPGHSPSSDTIHRNPGDSLANIEENERRDLEKKRIESSFERQLNIYQEQNRILEEHLSSLKLTQEGPSVIEKPVNPLESNPLTQEAKSILESCLRENPRQPLKCSEYVQKFVQMASTSVSQ